MKKIDYIYIYPKNWDGNISSMIYQEVLRGNKYEMINTIKKVSNNNN